MDTSLFTRCSLLHIATITPPGKSAGATLAPKEPYIGMPPTVNKGAFQSSPHASLPSDIP